MIFKEIKAIFCVESTKSERTGRQKENISGTEASNLQS
jgi:hypothetical protein